MPNEPSAFEMSDEDFLKSEPPTEEPITEESTDTETKPSDNDADDSIGDADDAESSDNDNDNDNGNDVDNKDTTDDADETDTTGDSPDDKDAGEDDSEESEDDSTDTGDKSDEDPPEKLDEEDKSDKKDKDTTSEIDHKSEYDKIMAPFTANGQTLTPKSAEDVIRLMQMGANYHKKMVGLKPGMKYLKLLEKNNLLDQEKINYLIDLDNKNPEAIARLVKESGIDPMEMDVKKDNNYKPTSRSVSDTEIDLDSTLADIKDTPSYNRTLNVITEVWDDASRTAIGQAPHLIEKINSHVADGTYDKVMGQVNYERTLGNLKGISDLDAYKQIGELMQNAGHLNPAPDTDKSQVPTKVGKVKPKKKISDTTRNKRRKAAGPTSNKGKADATFDPFSMSDEEIMKFDENDLPTG